MAASTATPVLSTVDPSSARCTPMIFVVDDDTSVRKSLDQLIRSAGWHPRLAASADEYLALPRVVAPACVVSELWLPDLTGLDLQRQISCRTELPIIFTSEHIDVRTAVQAMKAGAFELLTKPLAADVLLTTIRCALHRSRAVLDHLRRIRMLEERCASLSGREREVMGLVVSGRLNKQVSSELGISEITVKVHRGKMMRKMQAGSLAELVTMVESLRRWTESMFFPPHTGQGWRAGLRPMTPVIMEGLGARL